MRVIFSILLLLMAGFASAAAQERPLLLVVDQSLSMKETDPQKFAVDSVQLAVGTVREGKPFSIVGFGHRISKIAEGAVINNQQDRAAMRDTVTDRLRFPGRETLYTDALKAAYYQLDTMQAPPGSRVLFFTDGQPDDRADAIHREAEKFKARGWIVDGLMLNIEGSNATELRDIARTTLGEYTDVKEASDLVEKFISMTASQNDYFTLNVKQVDPIAEVPVLPGTQRLIWAVVKNDQGSGRLVQVSGEMTAIDQLDPSVFRYPKASEAATSDANLELYNIRNPGAGTYRASYDGVPKAVYVTMGLGMRANTIDVPDQVYEGDRIGLGVVMRPVPDNEELARFLASDGAVQATVRDVESGQVMGELALRGEQRADGAVEFASPWTVPWPDNVPRDGSRQYTVDYDITLQNLWSLNKKDSFEVLPRKNTAPPPKQDPSLAWGPPSAPDASYQLPPTWVGQQADARVPVFVDPGDAAGEQITLSGSDGFSFSAPIMVGNDSEVPVSFKDAEPGLHQAVLRNNAKMNGKDIATTTLTLEGQNYPWAGSDQLALKGDGPTGVEQWSPGHPDLPPQPLRPASIPLSDGAGNEAVLEINAAGLARLRAPPGLPAAQLSGAGELIYGELTPRPVRINYGYVPPDVVTNWPDGELRFTLGGTGTWTDAPPASFDQRQGVAGTIGISVTDLLGPENERLFAAYDARAGLGAEQSATGGSVPVRLRVYRGEDLPAGDYEGGVVVRHTAADGKVIEFTRPLIVTIP